jgi:hypothetical protein
MCMSVGQRVCMSRCARVRERERVRVRASSKVEKTRDTPPPAVVVGSAATVMARSLG